MALVKRIPVPGCHPCGDERSYWSRFIKVRVTIRYRHRQDRDSEGSFVAESGGGSRIPPALTGEFPAMPVYLPLILPVALVILMLRLNRQSFHGISVAVMGMSQRESVGRLQEACPNNPGMPGPLLLCSARASLRISLRDARSW